jgi:hypothetical protein
MKQITLKAAQAAWVFLRSDTARKLETTLIVGLITAVTKALHG